MLVAALAASHVVLLTWLVFSGDVRVAPIALGAAAAVAALGLAALALSRRLGVDAPRHFGEAAVAGLLLAQAVGIACCLTRHPVGWIAIVIAQCAFVAALLAVSAACRFASIPGFAAATSAFALLEFTHLRTADAPWWHLLVFALLLHAVFVLNPLLLGKRIGKGIAPHVAAVVSSGVLLWFGRLAMNAGGHAGIIGVLPVSEAALLLALLLALLRMEPEGERQQGRLALVAGAALAFVTAAIPLQLDKQWITVAWALECAALAWLWCRIPHRGLLAWCAGLGAAVLVRLTLNPAVWAYHARAETPILNWFLYTYLVSALALLAASWLLRAQEDHPKGWLSRVGPLLGAAATILLFWLVNIEIADYFSEGTTLTFNFSAGLGQDLTYTLAWAVFAVGLLIAGIVGRSKVARIASIALLAATVSKAFMHDLLRLGGLYRVASFVGLAVCLALVAVVFQKFVLRKPEERQE